MTLFIPAISKQEASAGAVESLRQKVKRAFDFMILKIGSVTRQRSGMESITGPEFKNPLEEIIHDSSDLQEMIREEFKQHLDIWEKRSRRYQRIHWDGSRIQRNMQLVLNGEELEAAAPFKSAPLQLPAPFQEVLL